MWVALNIDAAEAALCTFCMSGLTHLGAFCCCERGVGILLLHRRFYATLGWIRKNRCIYITLMEAGREISLHEQDS